MIRLRHQESREEIDLSVHLIRLYFVTLLSLESTGIYLKFIQETRKHSSRMRTARFLSSGGGVCLTPCRQTPPLDADPPGHVTCDAC